MDNLELTKMPEGFMVTDPETKHVYYGGNQQWLSSKNGVLGGCGTVAAANLVAYLAMTWECLRRLYAYPALDQPSFLQHMEEVYQVVTPLSIDLLHRRFPAGLKKALAPTLGVPGIAFFSKRVCRFAAGRGVALKPVWVDNKNRPSFNTSLHLNSRQALDYIRQGLQRECPVVMLNGSNPSLGQVPYRSYGESLPLATGNLQRHWVTVTGLRRDTSSGDILLEVATWGYQSTLSMKQFWGKGYTGLVYFSMADAPTGSADH